MELSYQWLCKQREEHSHNNSVWDLRYNWETVKPLLQNQLMTNTFNCGIPKACSLSPLMAALYLKPLDAEMKQHGFYVRFMNDWIVMVKTIHQLRKVIRLTHKVLTQLKLKMHPDKTFLGCIKKGFDFLGVHFGDTPKISNTSLENHRVKLAQRYAQGASVACIGDYLARWISWCAGVLKYCSGQFISITFMGQAVSRQLGLMNLSEEYNHEKHTSFGEHSSN